MAIPYDQLNGVYSLAAILIEATKYKANHSNTKFVCPAWLVLYDKTITNNATTVIQICAEAAHKSFHDNYASYEATEHGVAKFHHDIIGKVWYLKDTSTFYTNFAALDIITLLDANSRGLHALNMIALRTNMSQYYMQADGIPQFIAMMEDANKKVKRAVMSITNMELVMMALVAVLAAQHFLCKVDDWEGLPTSTHTWSTWNVAFCLAHLKYQHQLQASGGWQTLWRGPPRDLGAQLLQ
jgi:hypothetical protein